MTSTAEEKAFLNVAVAAIPRGPPPTQQQLLAATNGLEQILNMETSSSIANGIVHVPTLRNPRHETFDQGLAAAKTADAAYVLAGYQENRSNAARLNASQNIQRRVAEIQSMGAKLAAIQHWL